MSGLGDALERAHETAAPALGEIALALASRRIVPASMARWADNLDRAADILRVALVEHKEKTDGRDA